MTGRSFIGGLDPDSTIEHAAIGLIDHQMPGPPLVGRQLSLWTDAELEQYCRRYNIGWIVARSAESAVRFRAWSGAVETASFNDEEPAVLFTVANAPRTFALRGQATVLHMDAHRITLADVVPDNGVVDLSFHFQTGMRASPESVTVKAQQGDDDPIPFLRICLDGPMARITLTRQGR